MTATAAVAISPPPSWSDEELKKKPFWYRDTVGRLEHILKKLSLYSYVEEEHFVDEAIDLLQRMENLNNFEISWRLGRAQIEKANLYSKASTENRIFYLEKAISNLEKALTLEPPNTKWAGAVHKWLAIGVMRLKDISSPVSPSHPYVKKYNKQLLEHLEKAVKLDSNDAFAYHYLGLKLFKDGKYVDALKCFRAAEELKSGYYPANMTYLGLAIHKANKKDVVESTSILKQALATASKNREDRKAKLIAKKYLMAQLGQSAEDVAIHEEY